MSTELETAAEASAGGWLRWRRRQANIAPGSPCANCRTTLVGTYCHACGQLAEDFHKSVWKLGREALESFFHFDGRLARTAPRLFFRPGRLTRDYIDGKRAFQVPPLRLFLVTLLLSFLIGQCAMSGQGGVLANGVGTFGSGFSEGWSRDDPAASAAIDAARADIAADDTLTESERRIALAAADGDWKGFADGLAEAQAAGGVVQVEGAGQTAAQRAAEFEAWLEQRVKAVQAEPRRFAMLLGVWAQRVILLALPVSALILSCLFFWRRNVFVFDHLIFSMHSLTFQLVLVTTGLVGAALVGPAAWGLLILSPVHLFAHMRGAYGSGTIMTLLRMFVLFTATSIAASLMLLLWLTLAFNEMGG